MISETLVELSRWQFAVTALFHFLFVPLNFRFNLDFVHHGVGLRDDWPRNLSRHDQVLGQVVWY